MGDKLYAQIINKKIKINRLKINVGKVCTTQSSKTRENNVMAK